MNNTRKLLESINNNLNEASRRGHTISEFLSDSELAEYWEDRITSPDVPYSTIGSVLAKTFDWILHEQHLKHPNLEGTDKEFDAVRALFPALMKSGLEFGIDKNKLDVALNYFDAYTKGENVPEDETPWSDKYNHADKVAQDIEVILDRANEVKDAIRSVITEEGKKIANDLYSVLSKTINDLGLNTNNEEEE